MRKHTHTERDLYSRINYTFESTVANGAKSRYPHLVAFHWKWTCSANCTCVCHCLSVSVCVCVCV